MRRGVLSILAVAVLGLATCAAPRSANPQPSDVYFVEHVFEDHGEKLADGFQPTAEKALHVARQHWQVDPTAWNFGRAAAG